MILIEHVSLTLLTSFLSVYTLGKWSPPGIFRKVYLHVIWVPTMIALFSYDVFKYRSSSKTHRQKRMLRVWEIIGQFAIKGHLTTDWGNLSLFILTVKLVSGILNSIHSEVDDLHLDWNCTLTADRKVCNLVLKSGISIRKDFWVFFKGCSGLSLYFFDRKLKYFILDCVQ